MPVRPERQVLALPYAEAKERYGDRLAIASLSALEKSTDGNGVVDVRVLHDGTHGVDTNKYILVLDGGVSPAAPDLKATMRKQAARRTPHFGLAADVASAHKTVAARR